jgi:hypothetical protein
MKAYLVAVNLPVHAHDYPESAAALDGILNPGMRKHAGANSGLVDWVIAGDDIASSIATFSVSDDYTPDESGPLWPVGTMR